MSTPEPLKTSSGASLEVVEVGEEIFATPPGSYLDVEKKQVKVKPACSSKTGGHWGCVTHKLDFETPLSKDFHISCEPESMPVHRMVWCCYEHGPEVP